MDKLISLLMFYTMPLLLMVAFPFIMDEMIMGYTGTAVLGFITGMLLEGFICMLVITFGIITGQIKE